MATVCRGSWKRWLSAAPLALVAVSAGAQNLLVNPDFDTSLDGWTLDPGTPANAVRQWATQGWPGFLNDPGSVDAYYDQPSPVTLSISQCVPAAPNRHYTLSFQVNISNIDAGSDNRVWLQAAWSTSATCAEDNHFLGRTTIATVDNGYWQHGSTVVTTPPAVVALKVTLGFEKPDAGGYMIAAADALYAGPALKGDFHNDGRTDLVLHDIVTGDNRIWGMNGAKRRDTTLIDPPLPGALIRASDDFNGDGKSDLVVRDNTSGDISFWYMDGAARVGAAHPLTGAPTPPLAMSLAAAGDFNHDGDPDLLWRDATTQALVVWTMAGTLKTGEIVPSPDHAVDANWSVAAALDFDNDGNRDLLWYNSSSGKVVLWRMDANVARTAGEFTSPANAGANNWKVLAGGDYGIGPGGVPSSNDIVWRNSTSGKFVVWHMDPHSVPLTRTFGQFTDPDGPTTNPTDWTIVGPK